MGITWHEAKVLIEIYKRNGPLGRTATLGRQSLYFDLRSLKRLFTDVGAAPQGSLDEFLAQPPVFAEEFLHLLGATEVVSFDCADFERATVCHDMNFPLPEVYHNAFDVVYNGGTLEHIFNFPQAIRNCMLMPKESGLFISSAPANNWMGHGFYQFSPELFFRVLGEENGYRIEQMIAVEYWEGGSWFEVRDPKKLGKRVELWGAGQRIQLLVVGKKIRPLTDHWTAIPQQSDYVAAWSGASRDNSGWPRPRTARTWLVTFLKDHSPWVLSEYRQLREFGKSRLPALMDEASPRLMDKFRRFRGSRRSRQEIRRYNLQFNKEAFKRVRH